MYRLAIENVNGETLELTSNPNYCVTATGLSPMASDIITSPVANYGGARYVTSRQQVRNIVLTVYINHPAETNRINLYRYVKSAGAIRVYYSNGTRDVYIDGYVESFEDDLFMQTQTAQISIICPKPHFIDVNHNEVDLRNSEGWLTFPFYAPAEGIAISVYNPSVNRLITNESDDAIGFVYQIYCYGNVTNPMIYIDETGEYFRLDGRYGRDSVITISTLDGAKSVMRDYRGSITNIINDVVDGSSWLKLQAGYNHIVQTATSGADDMVSYLQYVSEYEGV